MLTLGTQALPRGYPRGLPRALGAQRRALSRLSSGSRLNRAADGAAELAIVSRNRAFMRSTAQARRNLDDARSLIQTADGGLGEISRVLARMRELGVQSANGALGDAERALLNLEFLELRAEIDRVSESTLYNGAPLLAANILDIGFMVDASASMNGRINTLTNEVGAFAQDLTDRGFDIQFGLAGLNRSRDSVDGVFRLADIGDGTFNAQLASFFTNGGPMDPYSGVLNTVGGADVPGTNDPDAFSFRPGSERLLIFLTDTGREAALTPATAQDAATAAAANNVKIHVIANPAGDDRDSIPGSDLAPLASITGGTYQSYGDNSGSNIANALQNIAGGFPVLPPAIDFSFQADIGSGAEDRIQTELPLNATASGLGVEAVSIGTEQDARDSLGALDGAIDTVAALRAELGATDRRLDAADGALAARELSLNDAVGRIADADVAEETAELAKAQILARAAIAVTAQAAALERDAILGLLESADTS